ncbi:MAG: HAMP domain-containing histidine kinase [Bacteroidetes bacterium]|nr:HAMP domain-containing histidine kinase [Bacteroidota bacterium]
MKRVFPLIVFLITLSVLGIIFIQMSWIKDAIKLRQNQRNQDIELAMTQIKENAWQLYLLKLGNVVPLNDDSRMYYLQDFTVQTLSDTEMKTIIDNALKRYNIKEKYEYCVLNIFKMPVMASVGYKNEYLKNSITTQLTPEPDKAKMPETLQLYIIENKNFILSKMGWMIGASILFTIIIISAFALTVRTLFNQKKLSEIKSDFINNMTHELKTPLATISLAIDALTNEKVIHDSDKVRYYSGMIKDENKRMNKQVEKILQAARIEKQDIKLNLQHLNAHEIIHKVSDNLSLQIQEKNGTITLKLDAPRHTINADEVHFSNIIFNLLDNAIKYSGNNLHIEVRTAIVNNMLAIKVSDNGIGMNRETQSRVFEKFYRAHTGNIHNVKGFGLGLSYVKATVEAHQGKVNVESSPGKGSTFTVMLPIV